jgi:hypothetical protein
MSIFIRNDSNEVVVASVMPVVAANAPNATALFAEQLNPGDYITMQVDDNSYLVVRPFNPVPASEADNNNG